MRKTLIFCLGLFLLIGPVAGQASKDPAYRETPARVNDLVHTKLAVRFDYSKHYLYGKEWVTCHPHFYPVDSLTLDAKGMDIKEVSLVGQTGKKALKYSYNGQLLQVRLGRLFRRDEQYTVYLDYVSKPDELKGSKGSAAITSSKGLYFINSDSSEPGKPVQVWTQGETSANSAWFPTIDKTNQKTTSEIAITAPAKYVTLSNGRLAASVRNTDGTRTDTWKMELPHAPYLFMIAVGDFRITRENYHGREISYYLEPAFAPYAHAIFGNTPQMIALYERLLGVPYPWNKYAQIVCRDYVSGAMENTTATLHGEYVHRTDRDLLDGDPEDYISHELFHQWFGDLVTCENWTNLTLNESFANYSEILWFEHKYGPDRAGELQRQEMNLYFQQADGGGDAPLVRFHYDDQEDMFDRISYQKGGRILHMLRRLVGDSAFFSALHLYLSENRFSTAEVPQLRMAFEKVTGQDLNWFFDQWYYGKGYPVLDISRKYDAATSSELVTIRQSQTDSFFRLPFAVDLYSGGAMRRERVVLNSREQTFAFSVKSEPDLVNVDGENMLLAKKRELRSVDQYLLLYDRAGNYLDRRIAIDSCAKIQRTDARALALLLRAAAGDTYGGLRTIAINRLQVNDSSVRRDAIPVLLRIAQSDKNAPTRAAAIFQLANAHAPGLRALYEAAARSRSYDEAGAGLSALGTLDSAAAYLVAKSNEGDVRGGLIFPVGNALIRQGDPRDLEFFDRQLKNSELSNIPINAYLYAGMLAGIKDPAAFRSGVNGIRQAIEKLSLGKRGFEIFSQDMNGIIAKKKAALASASGTSADVLRGELTYITDQVNAYRESVK